jgi:hypothetical protein
MVGGSFTELKKVADGDSSFKTEYEELKKDITEAQERSYLGMYNTSYHFYDEAVVILNQTIQKIEKLIPELIKLSKDLGG